MIGAGAGGRAVENIEKKTMNVLNKQQEHRLHPDPKMDLSSVLIACIKICRKQVENKLQGDTNCP